MSLLFDDWDAQFLVPEFLPLLEIDEEMAPTSPAESNRKKRRAPSKRDSDSKPKKRVRAATPRLRNKGKIELLRREIETLETQLHVLLSKPRPANRPVTPPVSVDEPMWKAIAERQYKERQRAEQRNRGLKNMLSAQHMLTMSLSGVLNEWTSLSRTDSSLSTCV